MKDLEMRTKDHIPLDFLYTNREIYKPSKAKQRWAKHEVVKMTNAKKLNRKNENILEELAGLKDDEVRVLDTVDMGNNRDNQLDYNDPEMENFNDADRDSNNGSESGEQIDQPTPLNLNKPMDEPD